MMGSFFQNKKILITGYEGFLGSHLTLKLLSFGAKIIGLDIKTKRSTTLLQKRELKKIKIFKGDVANYRLLSKIFKEFQPTIIFHLAAKAIVNECFKNPLKTFKTNIEGTWQILEICRQNSNTTKALIIASSDKAYGKSDKLPYEENYPLTGCHPYDVSKSCADLLAQAYFQTYHLPVAITRCGNIYGPGDFNFSRLIPETILTALKNQTLIIRSDGQFTRDYIYVDDVVDGYLKTAYLLKIKKLEGEAFNFSNEKPISVLNLVKIIYKILGKKPKYKILNQAQYEIKHQYLSAKKAKEILGWKPRFNLEKGLKKTLSWYKNYL